jgi:hypothetical protein
MHTLIEADALSEKADGVLPEEAVKDGHLANLDLRECDADEYKRQCAYRCNLVKELAQELDDVVDVFVALNEAKTFAPGQISNDIKSKEL